MESQQIEVLQSDKNTKLVLNGNAYFAESLYQEDFIDEKEMIKFIKEIEKVVRASAEYRRLMKYIRQELDLNKCTFLNRVDSDMVKIEMHHAPYNLFQICKILINKYIKEGIPFNTFIIAQECIYLHYNNCIGLVPLSKTMHELVHSSQLQIHKKLILGDIDTFYSLYKDYMDDDLKAVYLTCLKYSEENNSDLESSLDLFDENERINQLENVHKINSYQNYLTNDSNGNNLENESHIEDAKEADNFGF